MQKLSMRVIDKMIEQNCTGHEINWLLFGSRFQDDHGRIKGIYYKDLAEATHMSYQQFYNVKNSLIKKGIIAVQKNNYYDHDVTILDNAYPNPKEDVKNNPYINTNHDIFYSEEFMGMKPKARLMAMKLMQSTRVNETNKYNSFKIGVKKLFEKYSKLLQVSGRMIRVYLTELRRFFSIGLKEGLYYITPLKKLYRSPGKKSEEENYQEHEVNVICRRHRVAIREEKDRRDTGRLLKQYDNIAKEKGKNVLEVVQTAIDKSVDKARETLAAKERVLQPKLVHIWMQSLLDIRKA